MGVAVQAPQLRRLTKQSHTATHSSSIGALMSANNTRGLLRLPV